MRSVLLVRVRNYLRLSPDRVEAAEADGYRVVGGHRYGVDDISILVVREEETMPCEDRTTPEADA